MSLASSLVELVWQEARHAADFPDLCERCLGAWPGWLYEIMASDDGADAKRMCVSAATGVTSLNADRRLPLGHPLDGDWRFTRASASRILDLLLEDTPDDEAILLVAMPTVALEAHDRGLSARVVIASRDNDPIDRALRTVMTTASFENLGDPSSQRFATVAVDPPWYDAVALPLINAARSRVRASGHVFICTPDRFTMPSAAPRLGALAGAPFDLGFARSQMIERVNYATPLFELRCLMALGITNVSPRWRTGLLQKCSPDGRVVPATSLKTVEAGEWQELVHDRVRIWLRSTSPRPGATRHAMVATSISHRDPLRSTANLWTTGNTVAAAAAPPSPETILAMLRGTPNDEWQEALATAIDTELRDISRLVDFMS